MNPETIKQTIQVISEALQPLAEKIGQSGEYVFRLAVKQVYVDAVVSFLVFLVFLVLLIPYWKFVKFGMAKEKEDSYSSRFRNSEGMLFLSVGLGIALTIGLIISFFATMIDVPSAIINPEWAAIEKLLSVVKGK